MTNRITKGATPLGKELRKIRVDLEITRAKMAKDLGVSDQRLASIETGSDVDLGFVDQVVAKYNVGLAIENSLKNAYRDSISSVTFDFSGLNAEQRAKVIALQSEIDRENAEAIAAEREEKAKARKAKAEQKRQAKTIKVEEPEKEEVLTEVKKPEASSDDFLDDLDLGLDDLEGLDEELEAA